MATHSKIANLALLATAGACLTTAWLLVYLLRRNVNKEIFDDYEFQSSQHTVIEVAVSDKIVGGVIGRNGTNVKKIQDATSTRINFKNQDKNENVRIAVIRGKPNDAQAAERLIRKLIAEKLSVTTAEIKILNKMCGFLIGKGGANIRRICDISKAKVTVEQSSDQQELRTVTIKGTQAEIDYARGLIEETLAQTKDSKKGGHTLSTANKQIQYKDRQLAISEVGGPEIGDASSPRVQPLVPTGKDGFLETFISAAVSPSLFWVQSIGILATTLDKLVDNMTDFYEDPATWEDYKLDKIEVGDVVAAPFPNDKAIYRSCVLSVDVNDYDEDESEVRIYYVDFGDYAQFKRKELFAMRSDFEQLPWQANECRLFGVVPPPGTVGWSDEAVSEFIQLTSCAQWKTIMLRVVERERSPTEDENKVLVVELVDTNGEFNVDVAKELLNKGLAGSPSAAGVASVSESSGSIDQEPPAAEPKGDVSTAGASDETTVDT